MVSTLVNLLLTSWSCVFIVWLSTGFVAIASVKSAFKSKFLSVLYDKEDKFSLLAFKLDKDLLLLLLIILSEILLNLVETADAELLFELLFTDEIEAIDFELLLTDEVEAIDFELLLTDEVEAIDFELSFTDETESVNFDLWFDLFSEDNTESVDSDLTSEVVDELSLSSEFTVLSNWVLELFCSCATLPSFWILFADTEPTTADFWSAAVCSAAWTVLFGINAIPAAPAPKTAPRPANSRRVLLSPLSFKASGSTSFFFLFLLISYLNCFLFWSLFCFFIIVTF